MSVPGTALVLTDVAKVGVMVAMDDDDTGRPEARPAHDTTAALWLLLLQAPLPLERGLLAQLLSVESNDSLMSIPAPAPPTLTHALFNVTHSDVTGIPQKSNEKSVKIFSKLEYASFPVFKTRTAEVVCRDLD